MLKYLRDEFILVIILYVNLSDGSSEDNSNMYKEYKFEGKIVGGEPVPLEFFPFSVQLFNHGSMCAGTIISSWAVLTAAHCFDVNANKEEIVVQVGSRYVYDFNANQIGVSSFVVHEGYNRTGLFACDIAIVFLEKPIEFNENTKKTVLVTNKKWMNPQERNFTVTGWGMTQYNGEVSKKGLMMTHLRFISKKKCSKLHKIELSADMFCLYGDGKRDTCKGDSGGGVFWHGMIVGITSHGDGCANKNKPSIYTNVWYFRSWIKREMYRYVTKYCRYKDIPLKELPIK